MLLNTVVNAKYVIENEFEMATLNIDRTSPKIELISIESTREKYENNINYKYNLTMQVKIVEKNLNDIFLDEEHIKVKMADGYGSIENLQVEKVEKEENENVYKIRLENIGEYEELKILFLEGTIIDKGNLENEIFEVDIENYYNSQTL